MASRSAARRLEEIAEIIATGLLRAVARKSSGLSAGARETQLDFSLDRSGGAGPVSLEDPT